VTSNPHRDSDDRHDDWLRDQAAIELKDGRSKRARKLLNAAIGNQPGNPSYWYALGQLELAEGDENQAAKAFSKALEYAPDHGPAGQELDRLGVERPAPRDEQAELALPEEPEALPRTEGFDWTAVETLMRRQAAAELAGLIDPELASRLQQDLSDRPGRPVSDGVSEHLLDAPPGELAPWMGELIYRGRHLNATWRRLLSGPTPAAGERVVATAGVLAIEAGAPEVTWPRAVGDTPFPIELALPLAGRLHLATSDAMRGKRRKPRLVEVGPGDGALLCVGERPVELGGVWGRQGVVTRVVADEDLVLLRLRLG
jgi:tetratricopeptide repeat protein